MIRDALEAIADSLIPRVVIGTFITFLAAAAVIAAIQNGYIWSGNTPHQGISSIDAGRLGMVIGTSGTASAFLVTLYVAQRNYRRSREHIPHLTIQLHVVRTPVSKIRDVAVITLEAKNTGSALCEIGEIHWAIHALAPYDDEEAESMKQEFDNLENKHPETEFPWHVVDEDRIGYYMSIEPGQTEQITHDFLMPEEINAIMASAYVSNVSSPPTTPGWYRRTPHIQKEDGRYDQESK